MILTCPECATSYFVDDSRIPPQGRRVRCSSCGHRWLAGPDGPIAEAPEPEPAAEPTPDEPIVVPESLDPEAEEAVDADVAPAEPAIRPRPAARPTAPVAARREGRSSAVVWAGAAALAAALIAGVIVFRDQVVRLWPASSHAYAGLGFDMHAGGLVLEQVKAQPAFLAGRPVLAVSGAIRNVRDEAVSTPPVRVTLLNQAGKPVAAKIVKPIDATIPARARRHFAVAILDPPASARDLEIRFDAAEGGGRTILPRAAEAVVRPRAGAAAPAAPAAASETPGGKPVMLSPGVATEHG